MERTGGNKLPSIQLQSLEGIQKLKHYQQWPLGRKGLGYADKIYTFPLINSLTYKIVILMLLLLFLALIGLATPSSIREQLAAPVENGDLGFLRALNNFFGCKTWGDVECIECS